jgi:hypothetical protein
MAKYTMWVVFEPRVSTGACLLERWNRGATTDAEPGGITRELASQGGAKEAVTGLSHMAAQESVSRGGGAGVRLCT